jgi:hypothetical protein
MYLILYILRAVFYNIHFFYDAKMAGSNSRSTEEEHEKRLCAVVGIIKKKCIFRKCVYFDAWGGGGACKIADLLSTNPQKQKDDCP